MNLTTDSMQQFLNSLKCFCIALTLLFSTLILASGSYAKEQQGAFGSEAPDEASGTIVATVIIDGNPLFRVFGSSSLPARERAEGIADRIRLLAQDSSFDPNTLVTREADDGLLKIFAGNKPIVDIFVEDTQIEGGLSPLILARELFLPRIIEAIRNYRSERQAKYLFKNILRALIWTIFLSALLFFLFWGFKKAETLIERHFTHKIAKLEEKSLQIVKSQQIWSVLQTISRLIRVVLILGVIYFYIDNVLSLFPWTRYISQTLLGLVTSPLFSIGQAIIEYLPNLFFLAILFIILRYLIQITYAFFNGIDRGQIKFKSFDAEWAWPTYRIFRFLIIIFAIVVAYPYFPGSGSEAFKGISLLLGVLFSIGSSSLIANIIAGYTMTYRRAYKVGDRVKIGQNVGEVTRIRLLVTHLRSMKNEEIVIPNSTILSGEITNYSSMADKYGLILHTTVGIGYEVPWRQVEAMLIMAAERTDGLQRRSQPFVLQTALGDFGITYELNVFSKKPNAIAQIYTDLHRNIQDVFNEYKVVIMTPHYTGDTVEPKMVPKEKWYVSPANSHPSEARVK